MAKTNDQYFSVTQTSLIDRLEVHAVAVIGGYIARRILSNARVAEYIQVIFRLCARQMPETTRPRGLSATRWQYLQGMVQTCI